MLSFKESNKAFYGYVRSKQKMCSHVVQLRKKDHTLTAGSDEEAANELSSFFTSVFVKDNDMQRPDIDFVEIPKPTNSMLDFNIFVDNVCKKLKQIKNDKSPGPDGIHLMLIKKMA